MSIAYKRILYEYQTLNNKLDQFEYNKFSYKIIIEKLNIFFKTEIIINYKNKNYIIIIFYKKNYPFESPYKILLENINILDIYNKIISNNKDLKLNYLLEKSLLCNNNWSVKNTIQDLLNEIILIINYKNIHIKRKLLNKIIDKYTIENMDYLHFYLL